MTDIIELAKEAGMTVFVTESLERFAALVQFASANARAEREWVDLTDDEIKKIIDDEDGYNYPEDIATAAIKMFKEKNK